MKAGMINPKFYSKLVMHKLSLSDCHNSLAFGVDLNNDENITFFFKDLAS